MKKLSSVEISVISNEITKKVNEKKYEKIKDKLEKDSDYKKLEKLNEEIFELNKKVSEKNNLYNELCLKVKNKFKIISGVYKENNEIKVTFYGNLTIYNDIVLCNIGKELNVEELINKVVEKYS